MEIVSTVVELRQRVSGWRRQGQTVAFVPTMGNLHPGHLALVSDACAQADQVIVSIFVNPTQFGPGEDFEAYPRTLEQDCERLASVGVALVFAPTVDEMYPGGPDASTRVEVPGLSDDLCGRFRPGHFTGVATVVARLLNMVQPDIGIFGRKDYQQFLVIQRLARDLAFPVKIVGAPTVREPDGLAMSSRNAFLSGSERALAPALFQELLRAARRLQAGERDYPAICADARARLEAAGFGSEYFEVRRAADLKEPRPGDTQLVILLAARLGRARLIDNLAVELPAGA